jgi:hypothetical protein
LRVRDLRGVASLSHPMSGFNWDYCAAHTGGAVAILARKFPDVRLWQIRTDQTCSMGDVRLKDKADAPVPKHLPQR